MDESVCQSDHWRSPYSAAFFCPHPESIEGPKAVYDVVARKKISPKMARAKIEAAEDVNPSIN